MRDKNLKQMEFEIADSKGTSYRTIVNFEEMNTRRTGMLNYRKIDFKPVSMSEIERDKLKKKLSYLKIETLQHHKSLQEEKPDLFWQVVITTDDDVVREIGAGQLPEEWENLFRLLP
ncbi:hypothetical protein [Jeotgalibacillus salarius]|uniref:Uncharacterized protein n=1 Tax=Jeotgalibacillus salarius TaxID=546023 RepID=A0A4Y8LG53_9BACL|nr:hypothetical protein [Jeotgalibacillus salarius]TFE01626.1 hypothetical protein E2626_08630 [Jeotgalibacillus salarius]